ncbi:MlaD family protein [Pseudobacter ginsenosidimutans]|uniref:Phospholipid/cholesterol/gamma-HCH transport system substrate-binding protein n=1 Tax=Pseudobacter ginsenosidimutans TaxID=661488 RepID=A0A4Q7N5N2_9BACT|nr:MlaD family protein [Pseudobacter ginsenosidimutans]QEC44847.1 MCE family protein [Pseudobacter ginsenosidimutans]RZS76339.1 phospholipid/cholesterol/gamma-HCH transport system substrate-binding protein [Pseudobacter ginsenosidimutans]
MKISNETKVGSLTAIAIAVLILGFNFLKGKDFNTTKHKLFAVFPAVEGLMVSNPVTVNGLQVGKVSTIEAKDKNMTGIIVGITLTQEVNIPNNSVASLSTDLLGSSTTMKIFLGNSTTLINDGDTLSTRPIKGLTDKLQASLDPALASATQTLQSLDTLVNNLNSLLDPNTKNNLASIIANLTRSTQNLNKLLDAQTGMLAKSLSNVESVTGNLAKSNEKITATVDNLEKTSNSLANAKIKETIDNLESVTSKLSSAVSKTTQKDNTMGLLLNDRKLYDELRETNRSLTTLLDDFRLHPKRYVNISVFGRKDKSGPIKAPIYDSVPNKGN